jgi:hypothetical protein
MKTMHDSLTRPRACRWPGAVVAALVAALGSGCSDVATDMGLPGSGPPTIQAEVKRIDPVTRTGRSSAVLSVHMRKSYQDACKYGMTLTNNLPFKITNLTFRFTAHINGDVPYDTQSKNFYEIRPGENQYRELTFQKVACNEIDRISVTDPGRCAMGDLNRFSADPGDCRKFSDIASSSLVRIGWK